MEEMASIESTYGEFEARVQPIRSRFRRSVLVMVSLILAMLCGANGARAAEGAGGDRIFRLAVLGDSLTAGFGLPAKDAFPAQLERALRAKGYVVEVVNAGVSGDTASGARERLDWSIPEGTQAVIVELGANDALRGIDPEVTRKALSDILERLASRKIAVLLCGMVAPPNYGEDYARRFNAIFAELAKVYGVPLYGFFLDGVAAQTGLNQSDGMHPNEKGVALIVENILPHVEALIARIRDAHAG